ncbi:MAG: VacJ family lipoprotein [Gammaproteobacteria bacterium]|nr:VacJ family lipoprotein [Gammaproteobacteria bacterium]MCW5583177.1 VacJ family lipoprotein [Gammaproteobacteria bacterium]
MNNNKQNGFWSFGIIVISSIVMMVSGSMTSYAGVTPIQANQDADANRVKNTAVKASHNTANNTQTKTEEKSAAMTQADDQNGMIDDSALEDAMYNKDPLEKFNRVMFTFNDKLDIYLVKPIAELYNAIIPKPLNKGIHNFFNNLGEVPTIVNDWLQLNFYQSVKDMSRLVINSTMGIGGLFDIATRMNLPYFQNDFGLTLSAWGYKDSSYLVLPFLGSNTIRDGIGIPVDYFEFSVYPYIKPQSRLYQVLGLFFIDHRAHLLQYEPILEEVAVDKYVFMRNAYMQHRAYQIEQIKHLGYKDRNQNSPESSLPVNPSS